MEQFHFYPSNELDVRPSLETTIISIIFILSLLFLTYVIGCLTVGRLRKLFKENYWRNSNTIKLSIILIVIANLTVIIWRLFIFIAHDQVVKIEKVSINNNNWCFALLYLGL